MNPKFRVLTFNCFVLILLFVTMQQSSAQQAFNQSSDIGKVKYPGSVLFDPLSEKYTITGSGINMWYGKDEFYFVWTQVKSDFTLYSMIEFEGKGVDAHRKAGLIIRKSLEPGSPYVSAALHGDGLVSLQYRTSTDSMTKEIRDLRDSLPILQIERTGNTVVVKGCRVNEPLHNTGKVILDLGSEELYIGLFVCSHNPDVIEKAVFSNVRLTVPANDDFVPYKDYIGSKIEILDIETGLRKIVFETPENLEAPNWSHDGKFLVLNGRGKLYHLDLESNELKIINTDFATSNNNDHGISPDGKRLVISHHLAELPQGENSIIFTLPIEGGTPKRVTRNGPSFWHGWSPDGKDLIFTANRNKQWDIFMIPVEGGSETQLTNNAGLDDGSQYSSDGRYIWFNSNRSGSMEIWRMKADGSEQTQITNDEYQNWFAHESPDGKKVIFLSYLSDVNLSDHPYYKQVMLRIMNTDTFQPKVIAHLYGGQGTINVPSWSPDSRKVAFVSNTDNLK
jgi:TolB protein